RAPACNRLAGWSSPDLPAGSFGNVPSDLGPPAGPCSGGKASGRAGAISEYSGDSLSSQARRELASSGSASSSSRLISAICEADSPITVSVGVSRARARGVHLLADRRRENHPRLLPVALHGAFAHFQRFSNFLLAVTTEVAHLRDLGQTRIRLLEHFQGLVDPEDRLLVLGDVGAQVGRERQRLLPAAALLCAAVPHA